MTDENAPVRKHLATAKEHLAGLAAAAKWREDLINAHLLDSQAPIKDEPAAGAGEEKS
jgi:hypothetical protein